MKPLILAFVFCFMLPNYAPAQEAIKIKKRSFLIKPEGAKEAWTRISLAEKAFKKGPVFYRDARLNYLKAYTYNSNNPVLNYKIGLCYLYADEKTEALKYLKKAYELDNNVAKDIHFQLGRAYHMNLDFDNAIKEYRLFKTSLSPKKLRAFPHDIDKYIDECIVGKELVVKPVRVVVQNIGKVINSEYDDFNSVLTPKEDIMYFTSRRPSKKNTKRNRIDMKFSEDIYLTRKTSKEWAPPQIVNELSSKKNEAALWVNPLNETIYIYRSKGNGNIYYSIYKEGEWSGPFNFRLINKRKYRETSFCISPDGKKLFFVSNAERRGALGGKDIYYCEKDADGEWSDPINIGTPINTFENEEAVAISSDGKTLYFSSKGHPGMGGYDIFYSRFENGIWTKPVNMGYPINTPDDDLFYTVVSNEKVAYLSANRENTIGGLDIYKVLFLGAEKEYLSMLDASPSAFELYEKPTMLFSTPQLVAVDSSIVIMGKVVDSENKQGIMSKMQFIDSEKSKVVATLLSDSLGNYRTQLPEKKVFGIEISARGYLLFLSTIDISKEQNDIIQKDFVLQPISVGAKVVLRNIFFETGKATLKEESFQQLNNVITFLKDNPSVKLEMSGHTDNVGGLAYNIRLSEARAKAVVEYLIQNGIERSRLTFKGYGPHQPVASNKTPQGRAQNRRVEFKITGM